MCRWFIVVNKCSGGVTITENKNNCEDILLSFFNSLPQIALLLAENGKIVQINDKGQEWSNKLGLSVEGNDKSEHYSDLLKNAGCDEKK